ncbi:DUF6597 domain-containing transcriptional factor [Amycolatopsis sp. NPDC006131]|uniref:DUF6597 domain-containing transcriptional factor n=1 Tax=Amycolatopsis sp. NPDC006131 TaxID=3156731 RepID=UPI0033AF86B9
MTLGESYVERPPLPALAGVVRTVWIQRTGDAPYVQRHLPTGGVEIHFPLGGRPQLLGPLTGPHQAHLSRECLRLTGVTPRELLGGDVERCACGHDHSASYLPFLARRDRAPLLV